MIGTTLGHYRIDARLGGGGMGVVYRAYDANLQRSVAIKLLTDDIDPAHRARLLREGRAASALNHPNICTVHEVGEADGHAFLVMEYIEGQDLSDVIPAFGLPADTIVHYGSQIASALGHAHERGIVHRDLKATNVVIAPDGRAKVLDFGLAYRLDGTAPDAVTASRGLTHDGEISGTLAYMAPEVLQGEAVDARSDVWALGVLLYEMAAGLKPFSGRTSFELVSSILRDPVRSLPAAVSPVLAGVIQRCLAREPSRRYQRGSEVHAALEALATASQHAVATSAAPRSAHTFPRWMLLTALLVVAALAAVAVFDVAGLRRRIAGPAATVSSIHSIAVLPLDNLSGDPTQDYFADGMTEALISNLARIGALKVISRTSAMRYKDTTRSLPEIARELNVDGIVEGSVQRAGGRVRITAQLIHAASDTHLWTREYERDVADTLRLQSDVAREIANEIRVQITPQEQIGLAQARAVDPAAYEAFLRGRHHLWQFNEASLKQSIDYFERAIAIEPRYAAAYAGLSQAWSERGVFGALDFRETEAPQRATAMKALELDDSLADAHAAVGHIKYSRDWDWVAAEQHLSRAIELDPGNLQGRHYYAVALHAMGRFDEAISQMERVIALDPLSSAVHSSFGRVLYRAGRFEDAMTHLNRAIELDPHSAASYDRLADVTEATGKLDESLALSRKADEFRGRTVSTSSARLLARAGRRPEALAMLQQIVSAPGAVPAEGIAQVYAALGDKDRAFVWLNRAIDRRLLVVFIKVDPKYDSLRDDPRWPVLLKRINLTP